MSVTKFRKKPVIVEAMKTDGTAETANKIREWSDGKLRDHWVRIGSDEVAFNIETLEGTMQANPGDWIIKGTEGEFYPCKPDAFEATFEPVEDGDA